MLSIVLFGWFLAPFVRNGYGTPLGPDAPVYLWWTRLAGVDGLSAVPRPGVPALALTLQGALHVRLTAVTAALEVALAVAVGCACWALARAGGADRAVSWVAGLLGGTFAVHLASGYLATLAFAVGFVAGIAVLGLGDAPPALASRPRGGARETVAAALLFAAAALSHPLFAPLGLAILVGAGAIGRRTHREAVRRLAASAIGAGAVIGVALLALLVGAGPLQVDTSRDGFLRRAGMTDVLRDAYLDRFLHRWARYVQWVSAPLAVLGLPRVGGLVRPILWSWAGITVVGVALSLATGLLPADRFLTFGFALPILAAFGLPRALAAVRGRLWTSGAGRRREREGDAGRALAAGLATGLAAWMLAGSWIAWARQEPFVGTDELRAARLAADEIARTPRGTPIVLVVNERDDTASFLATRAVNVVRAAVPPSRIRDVVVLVPPAAETGSAERAALTGLTRADVRAAVEDAETPPLRIALGPFGGREGLGASFSRAAPGVWVDDPAGVRTGDGTLTQPLEPSSSPGIALASAGTLLLLALAGYGWARAAGMGPLGALALAPAFGAGSLTLVSISLERAGVPLTGSIGPTLVSALALGGGYGLRTILERRALPDHPPQVE